MLLAVVLLVVVVAVMRRPSSAVPPPSPNEKPPVKQNPQTGSDRGPDANQLLNMSGEAALVAGTIEGSIAFSNWFANSFAAGQSGHPLEKGSATVVGTAGALAGLGAGFGVADATGYAGITAAAAAGSFVPLLAIVVVAAVVIAETLAIIGAIEDENYIAAYDAAFADVQALFDAGDFWAAWDKCVYYADPANGGLIGLGWRGGAWSEEIRVNDGKTYPTVTQLLTAIAGLTDVQAKAIAAKNGYSVSGAKNLFDQTCTALEGNQPWLYPGHLAMHFGKRFGYTGTAKSTDWLNGRTISDAVKQLKIEAKGAR